MCVRVCVCACVACDKLTFSTITLCWYKMYVFDCFNNRIFKIGKDFRLSWSGLWLLTILLFTDVVNTSVSILNCPSFMESNGRNQLVILVVFQYGPPK